MAVTSIEFQVQGSEREPYHIFFERTGSHIRAFCTCAAGAQGQSCKHRMAILAGVTDGIVSANAHCAAEVASWLPGSNVAEAIALVAEAEAALDQAKKALAKAKRALGDTMRSTPT